MRCGHTSPFEMCEIKLHIKAPIFIARQLVRHRMANWNEISARYSEMPDEFWLPETVRLQSDLDKQSSDGLNPDSDIAIYHMDQTNKLAYGAYVELLRLGTPREQARAILPTSLYTEWYWKVDLNNLMKTLALRLDHHAQEEIREVSQAILYFFQREFPITAKVFDECILQGGRFTGKGMEVIRKLVESSRDARFVASVCADFGMSKGETSDFIAAISRV